MTQPLEDALNNLTHPRQLEWHESLELIFSELLDESQVRAYFHKKSHEYYAKENIKYQLPIIIISAIAGSGNFISSTFPDVQQYIILGVGGLSIGTSVISSISQFLKLSQLSEGHRIAYLSWEKFYANIKLQLRRKKDDRDNIKDFMNNIVSEYQRLKEISPEIPPHITSLIKKNKRLFRDNIQVPFIFDRFKHISAYGSNSNNTPHDPIDISKSGKTKIPHPRRRSTLSVDDYDESSSIEVSENESNKGKKKIMKFLSSKKNIPEEAIESAIENTNSATVDEINKLKEMIAQLQQNLSLSQLLQPSPPTVVKSFFMPDPKDHLDTIPESLEGSQISPLIVTNETLI